MQCVQQSRNGMCVASCSSLPLAVGLCLGPVRTRQSLLFVSDYPKPSFVLVRLVDEAPEDVIELLHVLCTMTYADVADQRCARRASVGRSSLIVSPDVSDPVLVTIFSGSFVVALCKTCYRAVSSVLKSASVQPTASVERSTLSTLSQLSPGFAYLGLTTLASTSAALP